MGLVYFPTERYGAVTRATEQPHAVQRLADWICRAANIKARASLGCEAAIEMAPNFVPIRKTLSPDCPPIVAVVGVIDDYCKLKGYAEWISEDAARAGLMRLRHGENVRRAIESAERRADFCAQHGPKVSA